MELPSNRDHLRRLDDSFYMGLAAVHWTLTILDRRKGWLSDVFYCQFRELLTHSLFRYSIACPVFCLMPDHIHLMWLCVLESSNQKLAMRHLRTHCNDALKCLGFELQDQSYDHVLREDERQESSFIAICEYIARNPERAGLIAIDKYADYPYTGCLVPGCPELMPFTADYWTRLGRVISWLRRNGFTSES